MLKYRLFNREDDEDDYFFNRPSCCLNFKINHNSNNGKEFE